MKITKTIVILFFCQISLWGLAQPKMSIRVHYSLSGDELSVTFNDLDRLADKLEESTASFLNKEIPIFNFLSDGAVSDTLFFELSTDGRSPLYDIILARNFIGENVDPVCRRLAWTLNDSSHPSYNIKNRNETVFVSNIMERFVDLFETEDFIDQFFRNRRMKQDVIKEIAFEEKQWILVYSFDELPIGLQSELKFSQKYIDPDGGTDFKIFFARVSGNRGNSIKVKIGTPSSQIEDANQASPIEEFKEDNFSEVAGFWIVKYRPIQDFFIPSRSQ